MIDGKEIIYHDYADVCIAVSSPKGLMVPVVRNAETMSLAEIEAEIAHEPGGFPVRGLAHTLEAHVEEDGQGHRRRREKGVEFAVPELFQDELDEVHGYCCCFLR